MLPPDLPVPNEDKSSKMDLHEDKSFYSDLPETPFNGVVISVDRSRFITRHGNDRVFVNLAIMSEDDPSDDPVVAFCSFVVMEEPEPMAHLREGSKVRVIGVTLMPKRDWQDTERRLRATITVPTGDLVARYRASQKKQ